MSRPQFELADVLRLYSSAFLDAFEGAVPSAQCRVLNALSACRTSALGGHLYRCDSCDVRVPVYNSCLNRHCPKCQASASRKWLEARSAALLPVEYFHVVFTLPEELRPVVYQNKKVCYKLLFDVTAQTLQELAADPKRLGGQVGFLSILHTWAQNLLFHPHIHCVVPGGVIAPDRSRWISCRRGYLLPVPVMRKLYRGKFLALLQQRFDEGNLKFRGTSSGLADASTFKGFLGLLRNKEWVVYAKKPFGGPEQVLKYLARYTHRVAISNHRLVSIDNGKVTFKARDYAL